MALKALQIKQSPGEEIAAEVMAKSIEDIATAMKKLTNGRLKREAIVALIHDKSKIRKREIEIVLNNLDQLSDFWLKKK